MKKLIRRFSVPALVMLSLNMNAQINIRKDSLKQNPDLKNIQTNSQINRLEIKNIQPNLPPPLYGFVDMHTHPVAQLAFGEQLFFGGNDGDPNIALGSCNCAHNFVVWPLDGNCGQQNLYRNKMVDGVDSKSGIPVHAKGPGFPAFSQWPKSNSILHQQMWIDWIKRARDGGLRVMVALAVNSQCVADAAETGGVNDDFASMNKQINEMKALFSRHTDFAEIAYSAADLRRIVTNGKLAIVLGVEVDNIGNFYNPADKRFAAFNPNPSDAQIKAEIDRLFLIGVRYIFPIHITNNIFGGAAIYDNTFNVANKYNTGSAFVPEWISSAQGITFVLGSPFTPIRQDPAAAVLMSLTGTVIPGNIMPDNPANYPPYAPTPPGFGNRNREGLSAKGEMAIRYMMQKGMLIDIDHMSEKSVDKVLTLAELYNYPVNSGHNGFRGPGANSVGIGANNENARTDDQVRKIYNLGGMMGLGHCGHSTTFLKAYRYGLTLTNNQPLGIGTDVNGFFPLPGTPTAQENIVYGPTLARCTTGSKTWDFNTDGVAHYGLLPDYIASCRKVGMTTAEQNDLFSSAERFAQMWEKCEASSKNVH